MQYTKHQGRLYIPQDIPSTELVLATNALVANTERMKNELGYILFMVDGNSRCNIFHYGSEKCKLISRSVLEAEINAFLLSLNFAFVENNLADEALC